MSILVLVTFLCFICILVGGRTYSCAGFDLSHGISSTWQTATSQSILAVSTTVGVINILLKVILYLALLSLTSIGAIFGGLKWGPVLQNVPKAKAIPMSVAVLASWYAPHS